VFDAFVGLSGASVGTSYIWLAFLRPLPEARAGFDGVTC
jgi:hypothetical protein